MFSIISTDSAFIKIYTKRHTSSRTRFPENAFIGTDERTDRHGHLYTYYYIILYYLGSVLYYAFYNAVEMHGSDCDRIVLVTLLARPRGQKNKCMWKFPGSEVFVWHIYLDVIHLFAVFCVIWLRSSVFRKRVVSNGGRFARRVRGWWPIEIKYRIEAYLYLWLLMYIVIVFSLTNGYFKLY